MEEVVVFANCECCGWTEECTEEYISQVRANFEGSWLCGICSEAVREEMENGNGETEDALKAHMSVCRDFKLKNAAVAADGMRSSDLSAASGASVSPSSSSTIHEDVGEIGEEDLEEIDEEDLEETDEEEVGELSSSFQSLLH